MSFSRRIHLVCLFACLFGWAGLGYAQTLPPLRGLDEGEGSIAGDGQETVEQAALPAYSTLNPPLSELNGTLVRSPEAAVDDVERRLRPQKRRRSENPYDPQGIPAGGLRLYPMLELGPIATSNVGQSSRNKHSAFGFRVAPSARIESDWIRHSFRTTIGGDYVAYAKHSKDNEHGFQVNSQARIDIRRTTTADLELGYALIPVGPDDSGQQGGIKGTRYDHNVVGRVALNHDLGAATGQFRVGVQRQLYGRERYIGGGHRSNHDLNNWQPRAGFRVTLTDPPRFKPFVDVSYALVLHDKTHDREGRNTNAGDLDLRLGLVIDDDPVLVGELALTYLRRDYRSKARKSLNVFGLNGALSWRPNEITTAVLGIDTSLDDVSSRGHTYAARLDVTHELRDYLLLRSTSRVLLDKATWGKDWTYENGIGLEWRLVPELALTLGYQGIYYRPARSNDKYTEHRLMSGIILRR